MRARHSVLIVGLLLALAGCDREASAPPAPVVAPPAAQAPHFFDNLGTLHRTISSANPDAQRWFDHGLRLAYAFNHQAAGQSFAEAAKADPDCAICEWGQALVLGPNINLPMAAEAVAPAWEHLQRALALKAKASPVEQALIDALATRYAQTPPEDRTPLDQAYADAMREVVAQYPDDLDAATLYAESLMDLMPWAYWNPVDRSPSPRTPEMRATLESVLARNPDHIGAIHYYIHATEGAADPGAAEPFADRLAELAPGAGHLVHMPAHTYIRVGRYHDATLTNLKATDADVAFLAFCKGSNGIYPLGYVPHNWHFIMMTAGLEGASAMALRAAQQAAQRADKTQLAALSFMETFLVAPTYTRVRFGLWDEILAESAAPAERPFTRAIWHFGRGMAHTAKGDADAAQRELDAIDAILKDPVLAASPLWNVNSADQVVPVAHKMLAGRIALARGDRKAGIAALREAAAAEDVLKYNEPPDWALPVRPYLGAALLAEGDAAGAQQAFEEDLVDFPENGWSLRGLVLAQNAQNKSADATATEARFAKAWANADVALTTPHL
jgi:hypothetical protein